MRALALLPVALLGFAASSLAADDGVVVVKLASVAPIDSPWEIKLQEFKKKAEAAVPGKLKVKIFAGGALGDENDTVLATKRGQVQAVGASTGAIASQIPELNVLELPYLFRSLAEADHILDNVIKDDVAKYADERGLHFGFWSENGFRSFGGKFKVSKPEDLKGRKMRSQENPIHLAMYRAFGASPSPIATTEALTALQTGNVEGYDQAPLYLFAASWHTASTNYSITDHIYQPAAIIYNKAAWDSWSPEIQKALNDAAASIQIDLRNQVRALTPILLKNLNDTGVAVNVLTAEERAPFAAIAAGARAEYMKKASKGEKALHAKIEKGLADFRAGKK